ncbi:histone-lysine N-methyltransferase set1-like [Athalia rosae]|uniref:histone-lysine N-methyltransferase set1-like n=1 Tax=Athalia rosae TaxID=37344 RepID=UPI002033788A|nr:histone-lysine N-methyltransferase set1-like [Athalia rosae]
MTVMPASGEVADKAVSTEDASSNVEIARLEAVLAALVETKVESMKASGSTNTTRRAGSAPASPRRPRLTSSSTASSSQNYCHHNHHHNHHHHHHHHHDRDHQHNHHGHNHHHHRHEKKRREDRRRRRHDSAPCGEFIEDLAGRNNGHKTRNGRGHRRGSEQPRSPRKRRRHSKSPLQAPPVLQNVLEASGPDPEFSLLEIVRDQQFNLLKFERAKEAFGDTHEFTNRLQQTSCCFSQSATQLKIHYDVDDYVALNLEDDLEEDEDSQNGAHNKRRATCDNYHRPKRKRKRRRRRIGPEGSTPEELHDPEELPPRARWTIVATACLLLAMSLLLVGVTLRMAPIIDDMVRKENEELLNSLSRDNFVPENVTTLP